MDETVIPPWKVPLYALGFWRPGEGRLGPRRPYNRYLRKEGKRLGRSVSLSNWKSSPGTFHAGWVLCWDGIFWHHAAGIRGPKFWEYERTKPHPPYTGPSGFTHMYGPVAVCSWRRRGSLRCDRRFARNMGCPCPHTGLFWPINYTHLPICPIMHPEED